MKHRLEASGRHRAAPRPRYGRISVLVTAFVVTTIAIVGALGWLPTGSAPPVAASTVNQALDGGSGDDASSTPDSSTTDRPRASTSAQLDDSGARIAAATESTALPRRSGTGRRVVYSEARQRVWLVDESSKVLRTYLVSGSVYDNLHPGTYAVYSRSRHAVGIDDSGTMEYFVRFTQGTQGAAIGFHTIPVDNGRPLQTVAQLGTPRSHGCIRQQRSNAIALWEFAPIGTKVVVTA